MVGPCLTYSNVVGTRSSDGDGVVVAGGAGVLGVGVGVGALEGVVVGVAVGVGVGLGVRVGGIVGVGGGRQMYFVCRYHSIACRFATFSFTP